MTPDQTQVLFAGFSGFHLDFADDSVTEREVLERYARGLDAAQRDRLYSAMAALLKERPTQAEWLANWNLSDYTPRRSEVESFVAWAHTPEGAATIAGPGLIYGFTAVRVNLTDPL